MERDPCAYFEIPIMAKTPSFRQGLPESSTQGCEIWAEREKLGLTPRRKDAKKSDKADEKNLGDLAAWREIPFAIPTNWALAFLGDLIHLVSGQHLQPSEYSSQERDGLPYVTGPSDFGANCLEISRYALVRKAGAKIGQILLTVKGVGVGKTAICDPLPRSRYHISQNQSPPLVG